MYLHRPTGLCQQDKEYEFKKVIVDISERSGVDNLNVVSRVLRQEKIDRDMQVN